MKTIFKLIALLAAVLMMAACEKDNGNLDFERDIVYTVDGEKHDVHLTTNNEFDALLDRFCDYAEGGSIVTFYRLGTQPSRLHASGTLAHPKAAETAAHPAKDAEHYSTTSREEMKRWMRQMEDEGKTVTVTYNSSSGTWNGTAYANVPQPLPSVEAAPQFSVSASRQVTFATGNLQYCTATGEYRMADSQYTTLCITSDTNWTDLFEQDTVRHLGNEWRLLTAAEATYLLELRFCSTVAGVENARYARAKVADVHGLILFPDIFVWPDSVALPVGVNNNGFSNAEGWNDNDYSVADWQRLEAAGAVFLPGTNLCHYGYLDYADGMAAYWTSTPGKVMLSGPSEVGMGNGWSSDGHAIRYVHDNE